MIFEPDFRNNELSVFPDWNIEPDFFSQKKYDFSEILSSGQLNQSSTFLNQTLPKLK